MRCAVFGVLLALLFVTPTAEARRLLPEAVTTQKVDLGGTVIFGAENQPAGLNTDLGCCSALWGRMVSNAILRGAFLVRPNFTYKLDLASKVAITKRPFAVTYTIKKTAGWSDGVPITASDFIFTWKTFIDPGNKMATRAGYEEIVAGKALGPKKVKFTLRKPYAAYKELFAHVFPEHALQGFDFNTVWNDAIVNPKNRQPIGSGPFLFGSWNKGSDLTIVRNPNFKLTHKAFLDKIVFRFITDTNQEIRALLGGEVDLIYPQPTPQLASLRGQPGLQIQSRPGTVLENIDLQLGPGGNALLKNLWMRQAVSHAVDRKALVDQLFRTLKPGLPVLNNLLYLSNQPGYVPHFGKYTYNPAKVASLLSGHGCAKGSDGIYVCGGQRVSFRFSVNPGLPFRPEAFALLDHQAFAAGINLSRDFQPNSNYLFTHNFDLGMFSLRTSEDPLHRNDFWVCGGDGNFGGYCNPMVTALLQTSESTLDPARRLRLVTKADALMANDAIAIPLYQKPTYLVYKTKLKGLNDNPTLQGPTWNSEFWTPG